MSIVEGPIVQVAWVSDDIDATETFLTTHCGAGSWTRLPDLAFGPETCQYRGQRADFVAHISLAYLGDMQLEIVAPVRGQSIYREFLDRSGPGLHHVCFESGDLAESLRRAAAAGIEIVQRGVMAGGAMEFAYMAGGSAGVPYIEIAQFGPAMRQLFDQLKRNGARDNRPNGAHR
jgi:catechol 2,3-dioxygenase-like lactoylglutathione lyase family enzyme